MIGILFLFYHITIPKGNQNALPVDDEYIAIYRLKKALESYPRIKIIGKANDGKRAVGLINDLQPELIFLAILMPERNGFGGLDHLDYLPFIVFVTACEEYAISPGPDY